MNNLIKNISLLVLVYVVNLLGMDIDTLSKLPNEIDLQETGELKLTLQFKDSQGRHILALLRNYCKSADGNEKITLKAVQYKVDSMQWKKEWVIWDFIACQNLDIQGDFLIYLTSITDIDNNRIFETTIAYQMICAGDVSPKTTKVIMRQGKLKYAVRGKSLVKIGKDIKYGGTFEPDKALNEIPKFKMFLIEKWKIAAGVE